MRDQELTKRPGRGWTPWKEGAGEADIEKIWWAARCLHFAKLNVSCWFDGSDLVGIEHSGISLGTVVHEAEARRLATVAGGL